MFKRLLPFLLLNFAALALGGLFTNKGVVSDWYNTLSKAPWTPPGWVFGAAWTSIMICFSFYMARLWAETKQQKLLLILYSVQWILNVIWNPVFFYFHAVFPALLIIFSLTLLLIFFLFYYRTTASGFTFFLLPYVLWMFIASSLNAYILLYN